MYPEFTEKEDRELRLRIARRALADTESFRHPPLRRVQRPVPAQPEKRGVYHRVGVDGSVSFDIVDSDGNTRFEIRPSAKDCHQRTLRWCERVLDAVDPPTSRPPLSVI